MHDIIIRRERPEDCRAVEVMTREAFFNVYVPGCNEHYLAHMLRSHGDFIPELDLVLEKDGEIIANIMYTRAKLIGEDGETKIILTFGPLSVLPKYQRQGYGKALLERSFVLAKEMGYDAVVIFGNPGNYLSRGFMSCKRMNVSLEGGIFPCAMLVKELIPGALQGRAWTYVGSDAGACCADEAAVAAFDAAFPEKEKAWRPSQEEFFIYSHSVIR